MYEFNAEKALVAVLDFVHGAWYECMNATC
jgi:hypothetical protein